MFGSSLTLLIRSDTGLLALTNAVISSPVRCSSTEDTAISARDTCPKRPKTSNTLFCLIMVCLRLFLYVDINTLGCIFACRKSLII